MKRFSLAAILFVLRPSLGSAQNEILIAKPATLSDKLYNAVALRNLAAVKDLLSRKANPNSPNSLREPILIRACFGRREAYEILKLLLEHGADPNCTDTHGTTPLIAVTGLAGMSSDDRSDEQVTLLLAHGADPNRKSSDGVTPLLLASKPDRRRLAKILLGAGAQLPARNEAGIQPIHSFALAGDVDRLTAAIKSGANVNMPSAYGATPLHFAAEGGSILAMNVLVKAGAQINSTDSNGRTPIMAALEASDVAAAAWLMDNGADLNSADRNGNTPLSKAISLFYWPRDIGHVSPGEIDAYQRDVDLLIGKLFDRGGIGTGLPATRALFAAVGREQGIWREVPHKRWIEAILDRGADVNATDGQWPSVLWLTVRTDRKDLSVPELLISRGADVNKRRDQSLLMYCLQQHDYELARLLVDKGARVDELDEARKTPLHWAAYFGQIPLLESLLWHGADIDAVDVMGQNALSLAWKGQHPEAVRYLMKRGASGPMSFPPARTPLGQPITLMPLEMVDSWIDGPVEYRLTGETVVLFIKGKRVARPISFDILIQDRSLWTDAELNNIVYQLKRGFYVTSAYHIFDFVRGKNVAYLGIAWYSPASSYHEDWAWKVLRVRALGGALEVVELRKESPRFDFRKQSRPRLSLTGAGELIYSSAGGSFRLKRTGSWVKLKH